MTPNLKQSRDSRKALAPVPHGSIHLLKQSRDSRKGPPTGHEPGRQEAGKQSRDSRKLWGNDAVPDKYAQALRSNQEIVESCCAIGDHPEDPEAKQSRDSRKYAFGRRYGKIPPGSNQEIVERVMWQTFIEMSGTREAIKR